MKKIITVVFIILIYTSVAFGQQTNSQPGMPVKIQTVKIRNLSEIIPAIGEIKSSQDARLASQFGGRITGMDVQVGDFIEKGRYVAKIRSKEAEILSMRMKGEIKDIMVVSPISGFVIKKYVSIGDVITAGQPIARIVSPKNSYILINISNDYLGKVAVANTVMFDVQGKKYKGEISYVVPIVDPATGTFPAIVNVSHDDLFPGLYLKLKILIMQKKAMSVPRSAVLTVGGVKVVYVIKNGKAIKRPVTIGIQTDEYIEIVKGLALGEKVAFVGNYELSDGMKVEVIK